MKGILHTASIERAEFRNKSRFIWRVLQDL